MTNFLSADLFRQSSDGSRRSRILLRAGISIAVLSALIWWFSSTTLLSAMARIPPLLWCLVSSGCIAGHILSTFKWRLLLQCVDVKVTRMDALRAHGAGLFANLCLPSIIGGDVVRAGLIMQRYRNHEYVAMASLADRIIDSFVLLLMAAVASTLLPADTTPVAAAALRGITIILFVGLSAIIIFIRWFPMLWLPAQFADSLLRFRAGLALLVGAPVTTALCFCLSLAIQSGFVLLNVMLAKAMGLEAPMVMWMFAWPLAKLLALAPISLAGIGIREVAIVAILAPFGIDAALLVAQSLSWEVVLIGSGLLAGLLVAVVPAGIHEEEGSTG